MPNDRRTITIIGAGAVARSIAIAANRAGISIDAVISAGGVSARRLARRVRAHKRGTMEVLPHALSLILIAVPDDRLPDVARELARSGRSFNGVVVLHTSGARDNRVLEPLKRCGASVGSLHPLQTFPRGVVTPVRGIWCSVEGDRRAVSAARALVRSMHANAVTISKEGKVLYHAAAVFASNYLVTLLSIVDELSQAAGIRGRNRRKVFEPLIHASLENAMRSGAAALTGPIVRGDVTTVEAHLRALSRKDLNHLVAVYSALGIETARLVKKNYARRLSHS